MNEKIKNEAADRLFDGILQLLAQRFEVARMLQNGITYSEIAAKTGASTATISRVNRCLNYGEGGYKTVLERLGEEK